MLEVMKKHHIKSLTTNKKESTILHFVYKGFAYDIPKKIAERYKVRSRPQESIPSEVIFTKLESKYTKAGVLLKGIRYREGLTQVAMAKKIKVTQSDLSKMERGKRSIGKNIAKRIEKIFGVNYRSFLE